MKVIDRLTGKTIKKLPDVLISGRHQTLELLQFNGHSELTAGDLILDDGSGSFRDGDHEYKFLASEQSDDDIAKTELATDAIIAIANKITHADKKTISPMLPSELAVQYELEPLEKKLTNVLQKGHLQAISDQPRRDLRYDDIVTPVARARRLATSAISHLASHSDCWQQRTLSGLLPRKVLARFSEDDYAIYENRLYKRMLDRLEKYLSRRLARIKAVMTQLEKALDFQNSEKTHHRLRRDICTLWGEVYQTDNTEQLVANRETIKDLTSLLRQIRGLKQRGLYKLIPINANVPEQVHRTNILNHDPHYRHIPHLWEKLCDSKENQQLTPKQRLELQKKLHQAYSDYVGLVIRRALERYNLSEQNDNISFEWATQKIALQQEQYNWLLKSENGESLRIVPIAWYGQSAEESANITDIICYPDLSNTTNESQNISISPLDLYVVERMGSLIDEWLIKQLVTSYAKPLRPIPNGLKALTDNWTERFESISKTDAKLITPLNEEQNLAVKNALIGTNDNFRKSIDLAIAEITALSQLCGHKAQFSYTPPNNFFCQCNECGSTWSVKTMPNQVRKFSMTPKNGSDNGKDFTWAGRNWLEFGI